MKRKLFILLAVSFLVGCSLEEFRQEDCSSDGLSFSLDEAREFFETDYSCRLTKSDGVPLQAVSKLHPEEEFYEYGKWGGGAFSSTAFDSLPFEERLAIVTYLKQIGLLL